MSRLDEATKLLAAAESWKERCLLGGGSLFTEEVLWTQKGLEDLQRCLGEGSDASDGSFLDRLEEQLQDAQPRSRQLCAEILWVYYLLISTVKEDTKRDRIRTVWEWSGMRLPENHWTLGNVLGKGLIDPGPGYRFHKHREVNYLVDLMLVWFAEVPEDRTELIGEAWSFAQWVDKHPKSSRRQLRHALLFMLYPDDFEPIMSSKHKRKYVKDYWIHSGSRTILDQWSQIRIDKELLAIRNELEAQYGGEFQYYQIEKTLFKSWLKGRFGDVNVWAISTGSKARFWDEFREAGVAAMQEPSVGDLNGFESSDAIKQALVEQGAGSNPVNHALAGWEFQSEMNAGDILVAVYGRPTRILGWGEATGEYFYDDSHADLRHRRTVEWYPCDSPIRLTKERQITTKTLTRATDWYSWVPHVFSKMDEREMVVQEKPWVETMEDLFLPKEQFERIIGSLTLRKNLMLQGPPGVGKTFIAKRIAWHLAGRKDLGIVGMVQFHQSYAYEDFVQGWRPTEEGGFTLRDGVFLQFCNKAAKRPYIPHTFIIDEINRGNLSRIFGELLMLIEADKRGADNAIALTYGAAGERFSVPPNVHILGLMNTADRSLAIVDYALRRRFAFETLKPEYASNNFKRFLKDRGVSGDLLGKIVRNLQAINKLIAEDNDLGSGFEIGHSYFVPEQSTGLNESWYLNIVETQIAPLLREYWFDRANRATEAINQLQTL